MKWPLDLCSVSKIKISCYFSDYLSFDPSLIKPAKSRETREANRGVKGGPRNEQSRNFSKLEELNQVFTILEHKSQ